VNKEEDEESPAPAAKSSIMSWAEVYRVSTCGGCNKTDCPSCTKKFLSYLNHQGQQPRGTGPR